MRITRRACEDLAQDQGAQGKSWWDDQVPGFGVRVFSKGRITFVCKYQMGGRAKMVTLGSFPGLSCEDARDEAAAIKNAAARGRDLLAERKADEEAQAAKRQEEARRSIPLTDLLDDWRATLERDIGAKMARGEQPTHEREILRLETKVIRPSIGDATVGTFDPKRLQALIATQPTVNHARNLRSAVVRFAAYANTQLTLRGVSAEWPETFKVKGRVRSRSHRYTLEEMARLWIAAGTLGRRGAAVRLMMLTGCRRNEARQMTWDHLHLSDPQLGPYWQQPAELTKTRQPHRVPLSSPAVALLRWLPVRKTPKSGTSDLVFAGRGGTLVGGWTDIRRALLQAAKVGAGTLHDFRRTLVSTLGDHGFDVAVADALLNHAAAATMGGVLGVYQRSELWSKRREAINLWADLLLEAVGQAQGRPVSPETWGFDKPFEEARIVRPRRSLSG